MTDSATPGPGAADRDVAGADEDFLDSGMYDAPVAEPSPYDAAGAADQSRYVETDAAAGAAAGTGADVGAGADAGAGAVVGAGADGPPYGVPAAAASVGGRSGPVGWRGALRPTAWLAAGVVGGAVIVAAWHTSQTNTPLTNPAAVQGQLPGGGQGPNGPVPNGQMPNGQVPNGQGPNGQGPNGQGPNGQAPNGQVPNGGPGFFGGPGRGGIAGEQHVRGVVTAVGGSSVTVRLASGGTATYTIIASSDIVKNGSRVSLSAIKVGDAVFLHVYPANGRTVVEHLFAGTGGPGQRPGDDTSSGTSPGTTET